MKTIEFEKPFMKENGQLRSSFNSWLIPSRIRDQHGIKDGDYVGATLRFDEESHDLYLRVTSGGELPVNPEIAKQIEAYAQKNPQKSVSFELKIAPKLLEDILEDIKATTLKDVPETTRKALVDARLGQGQFRADLMKKYAWKCAVTKVAIPQLLRASHIKPWRDSNDEERLSVENGLLLIANLDAAFDAGLISFGEDGKMLFCKDLGSDPHSLLGVPKDGKLITPPSDTQKEFLKLHREANGF